MQRFSAQVISFNTFLLLAILLLGSLTWILGLSSAINHLRYIIVILMYITVFVIVWQQIDQSHIYNLDRSTIWLIVFTGLFRSRLDLPNEIYYQVVIVGLTTLIFIGLIKFRKKIQKTDWRWVGIGLVFCVVIIPISIVEMAYPERYVNVRTDPSLGIALIRRVLNGLSFVSLIEEVIFRSLLWGTLRGLDIKESKIILAQGLIFWFLHLPDLLYPISFFITLPLGILIYSFLVSKSKQVFPSIILHTVLNAAGPLFVHLLLR